MYRRTQFRGTTKLLIQRANKILGEYSQKLTVRQLYYQFVARGWLPNTQRNYSNLAARVTDARYAGAIDWEALEDRGRTPEMAGDWPSVKDRVEEAIEYFRLPRWKGQANYVEVWVEKQALAGVLWPIAAQWHVTLMVNKGYSSASAMKESADRIIEACNLDVQEECAECGGTGQMTDDDHRDVCYDCGEVWTPTRRVLEDGRNRTPHILYLGDHDPSGEDMVRDIDERLREFGVTTLQVDKLALTMAQIQHFNPPPNPAKMSDSRAKAYVAKHGRKSWELDALPPTELNRLVTSGIRSLCDVRKMQDVIKAEELQKKELGRALKAIGKKKRKP